MRFEKTLESIRERYSRMDAEEEEGGEKKAKSGLGTRLPYALCKDVGIDTTGMTPSEAWQAYMGKTGSTPSVEIKKAAAKAKGGSSVKEDKPEPKAQEKPENKAEKKEKTEEEKKALREAANNKFKELFQLEEEAGGPILVKDKDGNIYSSYFGKFTNIETKEEFDLSPENHEMIASLTPVSKEESKEAMKNQSINIGTATASDIKSYFSEKYGCKVNEAVFNKKLFPAEKTVRDAISEFDKALSENEFLHGHMNIGISKSGIMCHDPNTGGLCFNSSYFKSPAEFNEMCSEMSKMGWWPKNSNAQSIIRHEIAHKLNYMLCDSYDNTYAFYTVQDNWDEAKKVARDIVNKSISAYKKQNKIKGKKKEMQGLISGYACRNDKETIAEAFADCYSNKENAHQLSRMIVEELNNRLESKFGAKYKF